MSNWKEHKLSDVVTFSGGSQPPKSNFRSELIEGYVRLIQIRDYKSDHYKIYVKESATKKFCTVDDVMIGRYGPPVFQILRGLEGAYNVALMKAIPDEDVLTKDFLYYFLQSPELQEYIIGLSQRAAGQTGVNKKALENYPILIPTNKKDQIALIDKLHQLFKNIDQSMDLLKENLTHTRALMSSILDEFYKNGNTALKELVEVNPKKSQVKGLDEQTEVTFLPMSELNEFNIHFDKNQSKKIMDVYKGYTYFQDNDVLLAKVTPCFENQKGALAHGLVNGIGFGSSEYHVLRANSKVIPEWIYYAVMSKNFSDEGKRSMTGAVGLKRVPSSFIENWKIPVPSINDQHDYVQKIQSIFSRSKESIDQLNQKLNNLKALKSSLLDQAFKGEL